MASSGSRSRSADEKLHRGGWPMGIDEGNLCFRSGPTTDGLGVGAHEFERGRDDSLGGDEPQAIVVSFGADALVATLAWHVVEEDAAGHFPRGVLGVAQR